MGSIGEIFADAGLHVDSASFSQYSSMLQQAEGQVGGMTTGMQTALAGAFAIPAAVITGIATYGVTVASSMQDASTSLTTVYGDLDLAKDKFEWLADFAASTPFEFPELLDATVKLKGYGIEAEDYMGTIGDAASAMGKTLDQTTEAVADAMTGEFERLKEYGIKAIVITEANAAQLGANLADVGKTALSYTSKSGEEQIKVVDRTNKTMVLSAIQSIWDVEKGFSGAMETRSKTMSGLLSTIKDNFSMGLADMVGFKDMEVQTLSLMSVLMGLAGVAVTISGAFADMSEPMQTFVVVSAGGMGAALALAGGLIAASAAGVTTTAVMTALSFAVNTVIWPATLVVGSLALVAAGLIYLDEKTGIVSKSWGFLADTFTLAWAGIKVVVGGITDLFSDMADEISDMFGGGFISDLLSALLEPLGKIGEYLTGFLNSWHEVAEGVRNESDEIKEPIVEVGETVKTTSEVAADAYGDWGQSAWIMRDDVVNASSDAASATQEASTAYSTAVADMMGDVNATLAAGIDYMAGVDIDDLTRGIRTVNDELIILNDSNELVKVSADGTVTKLKDMGNLSFETTSGGLTIMTDGIDDAGRALTDADILAGEFGNDVVIVGEAKLTTLTGEVDAVSGSIVTANDNTMTWDYALANSNAISLSNLNGEIAGVGSEVEATTSKTGDMNGNFIVTDSLPFGTLHGNLDLSKAKIEDNTAADQTLNTTLDITNYTPFGTLFGNLDTAGIKTDTNTDKTGILNMTLGTTNDSPFGTLFGNLDTAESKTDTNTEKTDILNMTLGTTNDSPFGTLFGNLDTGGTKTDTLKSKTDDANGSFSTLGSFSFSSTITGLGNILDTLGDIYDKAVSTIKKLFEVGTASDNNSSTTTTSPSIASGTSGVTSSGGSGTGESNVKIVSTTNKNTININTDKLSTSQAKLVGL